MTSNRLLMIFIYSTFVLLLILFIIYASLKMRKKKEISNNYMSSLNKNHIEGKISEEEYLKRKKDIVN